MTRISFWGSPEISARLLEEFIKHPKIQVEFVVTQEDKPRSSRGRQDEPTPVKKKADQYNIPVFTPASLKKNSSELLSELSQYDVDVNVVFAYGKIIPQKFFSHPEYGSLNFHASLLPQLRGASPIEHALILGLDKTGWTMQKMNERLDAGEVYFTRETEIRWEDDFTSLLDRLMSALLEFGPQVVMDYVQDRLKPEIQTESNATYCGKIDSSMGRINWLSPVQQIRNMARALSLRGGIFTNYNSRKFKLFPNLGIDKDTILQSSSFSKQAGVISKITDDLLWVSSDDQCSLPVQFIQPEGKKKLTAREFANGYRIQVGDRFDVFSG